MPGNKLLAHVKGKPVVRHVVEAALASLASPVLVVIGNAAQQICAALAGLEVAFVENGDYAKGLSESLKSGIRRVPIDRAGALVLLGDMPLILPTQINRLVEAFDPERGSKICVPVRHGRRGNPVLWAREFFPELLALQGDTGAKQLISRHEDVVFELDWPDDGALVDIDTVDDLKAHE